MGIASCRAAALVILLATLSGCVGGPAPSEAPASIQSTVEAKNTGEDPVDVVLRILHGDVPIASGSGRLAAGESMTLRDDVAGAIDDEVTVKVVYTAYWYAGMSPSGSADASATFVPSECIQDALVFTTEGDSNGDGVGPIKTSGGVRAAWDMDPCDGDR